MATTADDSDEYLPDSDDSYDEEEDERPNRWHGPKSTWQQLNSEEIDTLTALKEIRDRDLSIHLYNAFALGRRHATEEGSRHDGSGVPLNEPVPDQDINAATGQPVQQDTWLPQRSWTAWPMPADKVPPPRDVARMMTRDPDERFTFRRAVREMPSTALEEILSASILKSAKEKFNARPWAKPEVSADEAVSDAAGDTDDEDLDGETVVAASTSSRKRSRSRSKSVKSEDKSKGEKMDTADERNEETHRERYLRPVVSTNDDLSYSLLRPSVRHILTKLDATLTILHNAQEAAVGYQSDSGSSEVSEGSSRHGRSRRSSRARQGSQTPTTPRKRGRPIGSQSQTPARRLPRTPQREEDQPDENGKGKGKAAVKRRVGRPKKTYPRLDGETDREYAIRIARLRKEPIPVFSDEEPEPDVKMVEDERGVASGSGESTVSPSRGRTERRRGKQGRAGDHRSPSETSVSTASGRRNRTPGARSKTQLGLRDWRDVLGAAALAGFPPAALDRAARRCADLFGQSMTLQTLPEGPTVSGGRKAPPYRATTYVPGMPQPPLIDEDDEDENAEELILPIRASSAATSGDETAGPSRARSRSMSRARSRSGSASAPGAFLCSFRECPRAADGEGFSRRQNLLRHLKLVHGWSEPSGDDAASTSSGTATARRMAAAMMMMMEEEVDSEDEMHGAVHVDGFLRRIRMRPGWRAGDVAEEPRRRRVGGYGKARGRGRGRGGGKARGSDEDEDEDGDTRMESSG
ncbi:hypothetical protein AAE478_009209 [Parahypoxylon ruwenzoriense]